jgi:hypothetical protein
MNVESPVASAREQAIGDVACTLAADVVVADYMLRGLGRWTTRRHRV